VTTYSAALKAAQKILTDAGVPSPAAESRLLLAHATNEDLKSLENKLVLDAELSESAIKKFDELIRLRSTRVPLQHLTGVAAFRYLELNVGSGVFVPRPETESVVQLALDFLEGFENPKVLDIGTGSGAIAISIATERPDSKVTALEKSVDAHKFASQNNDKYGLLVNLNLTDFADFTSEQKFDLVISNPPYIPTGAVPRDPEVRDFDPSLALYSGEDGLNAIRLIADKALDFLEPNGLLILEHADSQSNQVCELLWSKGWNQVTAHLDATGRYRMVSAVR
jgi:release factor glutamine methyltransferase